MVEDRLHEPTFLPREVAPDSLWAMTGTVPATEPRSDPPTSRVDWAAAGRSPARAAIAPPWVRGLSAILAIGCFGVLVVAWWLSPSSEGLGTHQQLGLPECGWITAANMPCPTCGMTTAFSHAAHGDLPGSFGAQPMGMLLAVGAAVMVVVGGYTALTGSMLAPFLWSMFNARVAWILGAFALFAWIWKIIDHRGIL